MAAEPRTHVAFPQSVEDFEHDERVSFSRADNKWTLENDDGSEWEWDEIANRWMPTVRSYAPKSPTVLRLLDVWMAR